MSKLLAYTIAGQVIGIDIQSWDESMLSGNTAFITIPDTGSTPSNYTDISSVANWNQFGNPAGFTEAQVKQEIIKLIPDKPTPEQYQILENYATVGLNSMTNINGNLALSSQLINGYLSGVTDTKFNTTGGTVSGDIKTTGAICGINGTLDVGGNFNVGGNIAGGGCLTIGGNVLIGGIGVVTSASNLGTGQGVFSSLSAKDLRFKSLSGGTNVTLSSNATTITISAAGGTGGTTVWGGITGTLSNQTDLQNALDAKLTTTTFNTYSANTLTNINSRLLKTTFATYTGTTAPTTFALKTAAITGATNLGAGQGIYGTTSSNRLNLKSLVAGSNITLNSDTNTVTINAAATAASIVYSAVTSAGNATTSSTSDTLMTGMQITNVGTGTYALSFGTSLSHGSNNASIYTNIYVGGAAVSGSEITWNRPNATITTNHGYSNFIITISTPSTVDIRWRTTTGTATSVGNRYLTLLRLK